MENKKDENGEVSRCRFCESKFHYRSACPEYTKFLKDEKGTTKEAFVVVEEEEIDISAATAPVPS